MEDFFKAKEFFKELKWKEKGQGFNILFFNGGSRDYCNDSLTIGMQTIIRELNEVPGVFCDVAYIPPKSQLNLFEKQKCAITGVYSEKQADEFDMLMFSFYYQYQYINLPWLLARSRVQPLTKDRKTGPIVMSGGFVNINPESIAEFVDLAFLGEFDFYGQKMAEILKEHSSREDRIAAFAQEPFIYRPSDFEPEINDKGRITGIYSKHNKEAPVKEFRTVPGKDLIPYNAITEKRETVTARGCNNVCSFCVLSALSPKRDYSLEQIKPLIKPWKLGMKKELKVFSPDEGDTAYYPQLVDYIHSLGYNVASGDCRVTSMSKEWISSLKNAGGKKLSLGIEGMNQLQRDFVNKNCKQSDIYKAFETLFEINYPRVKLFYILKLLPYTPEVVADMEAELKHILEIKAQYKATTLLEFSLTRFVSVPQTPFQWLGYIPRNMRADEKIMQFYQKMGGGPEKGGYFIDRCEEELSNQMSHVFGRADRRIAKPLIDWTLRDGNYYFGSLTSRQCNEFLRSLKTTYKIPIEDWYKNAGLMNSCTGAL